jgi:hypothetical protein
VALVKEVDGRKVTKKFRKWWKKHRKHLILKQYGTTWCAKCLEPTPWPFKEES